MIVVIEGVDGTGKSTLAHALHSFMPKFKLQESEGPPKSADEIEERLKRYDAYENVIFVRHPCISDPIYSRVIRDKLSPVAGSRIANFKPDLAIYCHPAPGRRVQHVIKEGEDAEHIALIAERYLQLVKAYVHWAVDNAHYIYRIGDEAWPIKHLIGGYDLV